MDIITRDQLAALLDNLASSKTLIAPCEVEDVLLYQRVPSSAEVAWDFDLPVLSAKGALFPPTERLMTIEKGGDEGEENPIQLKLLETIFEDEQVIFGVRPCDARGFKALDALLLETEPIDTYYARRREKTTLIGLACEQMGPSCFCTSLGGAPDDWRDVDLMLTEIDDGYAVKVVTEKGRALLGDLSLRELPGEPAKPVLNDPLPVPSDEAWTSQFNDGFWDNLAERCLSCRICAYVCPVCRCFDVRDELIPATTFCDDHYERIRCWDSCTGVNYRKIAGGHNPRSEKGQRLRNRFNCKFYYYPQQYGVIACTGCGRCIDACPVNIDITEVMEHLVITQEGVSK